MRERERIFLVHLYDICLSKLAFSGMKQCVAVLLADLELVSVDTRKLKLI